MVVANAAFVAFLANDAGRWVQNIGASGGAF
jgi:hypothetical protein